MALRIRNKWRANRPASLEENATALAYVIWQLGLGSARNLHTERFDYDSDEQRVAVIAEYLCFLIHIADRLAYVTLSDSERQTYIVTLAQDCARHMQRNQEDIFGPGDYRQPFIELLNQRAAEYATYKFTGHEPGFDLLRGLGQHVQTIMGESQTNRWVIDQVMSIDAPAAVEQVRKSMDNLFASSRNVE